MRRDEFHPMRQSARNPAIARAVADMRDGTEASYKAASETLVRAMAASTPTVACDWRDANALVDAQLYNAFALRRFVRSGRNVFVPDDVLAGMLDRTDLGEARLGDLVLPYVSMFVAIPACVRSGRLPGKPNEIDGVYLTQLSGSVEMIVVGRWSGDARRPWPYDEDPVLMLTVDGDIPFGDALDAAVDWESRHRVEISLKMPSGFGMACRTTPDRQAKPFTAEERASVARAATFALNVACYLTSAPDDVERTPGPDDAPADLLLRASAPGKVGLKARQALVASSHLPVIVVGRGLARRAAETVGDSGASPSPHWRRGHWRNQRHGSGLTSTRLRWILPVAVNARRGAPDDVDRVYLVQSG